MTSSRGVPALPSICRMVQYRVPTAGVDHEPVIAPARVTYVWKGPGDAYTVNLQVDHLDQDGSYLVTGAKYSETDEGCWFWPPRVG